MDLKRHLLFSILYHLCECYVPSIHVKHDLWKLIETANQNSSQYISSYGYESETHKVVTNDGYILTVFRILNRSLSDKKKTPVLLVHGILDSSDSWVIVEPKSSLAYTLSDAGYDIWLLNVRGNKYSQSHVKNLTPKKFWDFSYEEMGSEDLPATIDYILQKTKASQITYIGFSQGTTIFLVMCSLKPEYNDKIRQAVLLAPVASTEHITLPFLDFWTANIDHIWAVTSSMGIFEVFPDSPPLNTIYAKICRVDSILLIFCQLRHYLTLGLTDIRRVTTESRPWFGSHIPTGTSAKTFVHYIKGVTSKKFQRFDYGTERNQRFYKSVNAPEYDLSLVTVPITIMSSEIDWLSDPIDVKWLKSKLSNVVNFMIFNKTLGMTHVEFIYGNSARTLINNPILKILDKPL